LSDGFLSRIGSDKPEPRKPTGPVVPPSDAYAKKALEDEIKNLSEMSEGSRNAELNNSALKLARLPIDRNYLRDRLIDACQANGHLGDDGIHMVEGTINSAFDKADRDGPRMVPERPEKPTPVSSIGKNVKVPEKSVCEVDTDVWGTTPPIDGAEWMFKPDDRVVELWGRGDDILWARGEAFLLAGNQGCGKSTLAGQLIRAQLGLQDSVLGLPVMPADRPILMLAMDRPAQIRRSLRRQFSEDERDAIEGRLFIRPGPPVSDMAIDPTLLRRMAEAIGAGVVYVDSLKDAAVGLSTDETGSMYNRARQGVLAAGIDLCELHHIKKPSQDSSGGGVSDVYGSTWITSGAGSVITLSGEPGDLEVRFRQVKSPANEVGPWKIHLDPDKGEFSVRQIDLLVSVRNAGHEGLTAEGAAMDIYECRRPSVSEKKKAERKLNALVVKGLLTRLDGNHGPVWFLAENRLENSF
jgi:hypothetical protein